jgi:peptidoglycan hydrolase CwlO-like protein
MTADIDARTHIALLEGQLTKLQAELEAAHKRINELELDIQRYQLQIAAEALNLATDRAVDRALG